MDKENAGLVSIIIPMFNEEKNAGRCLEALLRQTYPNIEIIVVDDGSSDGTREIASRYTEKVLTTGRKGISSAKNTGLKSARGEFAAFTDADCIPEKDWIEELMKCFHDKDIVSAGGPNLVSPEGNMFSRAVDGIFFFLARLGFGYVKKKNAPFFISHNPGCNVVYKKEIFDRVGLFDERLISAEDEELDYRITKNGYKIFFTPHPRVKHLRRSSFFPFCGQMYRYSLGKMQVVRLHGELLRALFFVPSLILIIFTLIAGLSFFSRSVSIISAGFFILGGFSVVLTALYVGFITRLTLVPFYLLLLPLACFSCGAGFLGGIFKRT